MGLKSSGDGRQRHFASVSRDQLASCSKYILDVHMQHDDHGKFVFVVFFSCSHALPKTRFWPHPQLTKGVNDAIKHGAHKMDWLLMKAGKWGGWQGRRPPWGDGRRDLSPAWRGDTTATVIKGVISLWHKVAGCVCRWLRGHVVSKSRGWTECSSHVQPWRKRCLSDAHRNG